MIIYVVYCHSISFWQSWPFIYFLFPIFEHFFNNKQKYFNFLWRYYCLKSVCIPSFFGPCYPAVGLNTEIYGVFLRIQSGCGKMWTRKNSEYGHFLLSVLLTWIVRLNWLTLITCISVLRRVKGLTINVLCYVVENTA